MEGRTARNSAIELHVRPRKSQAYIHFSVRPAGESDRNWKLAEREGFEPSVEFPLHTLSKRARSTTPPSLRFRINGLRAAKVDYLRDCDTCPNVSRSLTAIYSSRTA